MINEPGSPAADSKPDHGGDPNVVILTKPVTLKDTGGAHAMTVTQVMLREPTWEDLEAGDGLVGNAWYRAVIARVSGVLPAVLGKISLKDANTLKRRFDSFL